MTTIKICGITTKEIADHCVQLNLPYLGFVFYPPSSRHISPEAAKAITVDVPISSKKVAVTVDASDALLDQIVEYLDPQMIQCHGNESPERIAVLSKRYTCQIMKALAISEEEDVEKAQRYDAAHYLLFDAKPPKDLPPGGNGLRFDWQLLANRVISKPWFLSGGLNIHNIKEALTTSGAKMVDISSGVESSPGIKDKKLITEFVACLTNHPS